MAWPPTPNSTTGFEADGVTTIRWGTEGLLQGSLPPISATGYYVVLRFNQKELSENIKLPQGSGLTSTRVRIRDGVQWAITVRDDTQMTAPICGDLLTIVDGSGMLGDVGLTYSARVVENDYETAVKQAGERVLMLENLVLIESQSSGTQS